MKAALDGLNTTVTPTVNVAGTAETLAALQRIAAVLREIRGLASGAMGAARGISVPSLGAVQRNSFSTSGIRGD